MSYLSSACSYLMSCLTCYPRLAGRVSLVSMPSVRSLHGSPLYLSNNVGGGLLLSCMAHHTRVTMVGLIVIVDT